MIARATIAIMVMAIGISGCSHENARVICQLSVDNSIYRVGDEIRMRLVIYPDHPTRMSFYEELINTVSINGIRERPPIIIGKRHGNVVTREYSEKSPLILEIVGHVKKGKSHEVVVLDFGNLGRHDVMRGNDVICSMNVEPASYAGILSSNEGYTSNDVQLQIR